MVTVTPRRESLTELDPNLFTFKPKLNEKSNQIAENLLSDFHERQLKHIQKVEEIQKEAAIDYRSWYCSIKPTQVAQTLPNLNVNNKPKSENKPATADSIKSRKIEFEEKSLIFQKEARQSNAHLSQLIRTYQQPTKSKTRQSSFSLPMVSQTAQTTENSTNSTSSPTKTNTTTTTTNQISPSNCAKSSSKNVRVADVSPKRSITSDSINTERLKLAKDEAERAMKEHKIFTIIGPYPALRESLRRRGWIEKFYRGASLPSIHGNRKSEKKTKGDEDDEDDNDDNDDDDDLEEHPSYEDEGKVPPWEENDGYYGLLSRLVRTAAPNFIWSVRATFDSSTLSKDQMANHFSRNGCCTTKVGLCNSLRNLQWFHSGCADEFYPRCYKLSQEDDKIAFIDDYRLTACISFLKLIQNRCKGVIEPDMNSILAMSSDSPTDSNSPLTTTEEEPQLTRSVTLPPGQLTSKPLNGKTSSKIVPIYFIEFALNRVNEYILSRDHEDIDLNSEEQSCLTDEQWTRFIEQFYAASHSNADIEGMEIYLSRIDKCLKDVQQNCPQYHIDGTRNIWILKPGAKSRGRGIVVYDRLEDILKLCSSTLTKDGKFVVQKYIERPLLIHNTKFDIRQWFLVTDWNPLTIWMFKDCYLRFCTEHFSLETRQQNVHLCNYSIQKHYKNNSNRHSDLPVENMWTNKEFIEKYLRPNHLADRWDQYIYPAMKNAIICSMLVSQDVIDTRKNSFELFGADFMLGEDLKPWLIEINSSPTMARSTAVTAEMCDGVLEDTCKVMIDRKFNRQANTGRFELIHRGTPVPVPIYIGIDLRVEGKICKTGKPLYYPPINPAGTQNNNNNNNNLLNLNAVPPSAPPQIKSPSSSPTSSSTPSFATPAETQSVPPPVTTSLSSHRQSFTVKSIHQPVTLKLRREMTQPALSRVELISSSDVLPLEKLVETDTYPFPIRITNPNNKLNHYQSLDIRSKQLKMNSNRISADYGPVRQISRSKVNDTLPSPKGNSYPTNRISKINVTDFLYADRDVRISAQIPFFRAYQRSWFSYKSPQFPITTTTTNAKTLRRQKTTIESSDPPSTSALSFPTTTSNFDKNNERNSSASALSVA